jgi:hypothetical protein
MSNTPLRARKRQGANDCRPFARTLASPGSQIRIAHREIDSKRN